MKELIIFEINKLIKHKRFGIFFIAGNFVVIALFILILFSFVYKSNLSNKDIIGYYEIVFKFSIIAHIIYSSYFIQLFFIIISGNKFSEEYEKKTLHTIFTLPVKRISIFFSKIISIFLTGISISISGIILIIITFLLTRYMYNISYVKEMNAFFYILPLYFSLSLSILSFTTFLSIIIKKFSKYIILSLIIFSLFHFIYWSNYIIKDIPWFNNFFIYDYIDIYTKYFFIPITDKYSEFSYVIDTVNGNFAFSVTDISINFIYTFIFLFFSAYLFKNMDCK